MERRYFENPKSFADATFSMTSEEFFDGPGIIHITIAKGSFTVFYNTIF